MIYVNTTKKKTCGRNNQPIPPMVIDYATVENVPFQFIDSQNKIQELDSSMSGLYFAASLGIGQKETLLFVADDYTIEDNAIDFTVDTYTSTYLEAIKKKYTEVNIEIGQSTDDGRRVLLRDIALACPRVYVDGEPPQPPYNNYYTKSETNDLVSSTLSSAEAYTDAHIQTLQEYVDEKTAAAEWETIDPSTASATISGKLYLHTPSSAPSYTLLDVDDNKEHEVTIDVKFSSTQTIAFLNEAGSVIPMLKDIEINADSVWRFYCVYSPLQSSWKIMPISLMEA